MTSLDRQLSTENASNPKKIIKVFGNDETQPFLIIVWSVLNNEHKLTSTNDFQSMFIKIVNVKG